MARLPIPGGDQGNWGDILNEFLSQAHTSDGQLKNDVVTAAALQNGSVSGSILQDGGVSASKLSASGGATGEVLVRDTTVIGGLKWDTVGGVSGSPTGTAGGDLAGTYPNPTVPGLADKADITHSHVIGDITGLETALDAKLDVADAGAKVMVFNTYADAPALPVNTIVVSITGS